MYLLNKAIDFIQSIDYTDNRLKLYEYSISASDS